MDTFEKSAHCWRSSWTLTRKDHPGQRHHERFEADSLDIVDMVMTLEDEFGIEVPDDAIETLRTVGDVVNFVDSHQG